VVDELVEMLIRSETRESLVAHTNALDRILLWSHYVVPSFSKPDIWWARSGKLARMDVTPLAGQHPALWWEDREKAEKVAAIFRNRGAGTATQSAGDNSRTLLMGLAGAAALVVLFMILRRRRA
jgi:hypothetical protein